VFQITSEDNIGTQDRTSFAVSHKALKDNPFNSNNK